MNTMWRLSKIISRYKLQPLRNAHHRMNTIFPVTFIGSTNIYDILRKKITFFFRKVTFNPSTEISSVTFFFLTPLALNSYWWVTRIQINQNEDVTYTN